MVSRHRTDNAANDDRDVATISPGHDGYYPELDCTGNATIRAFLQEYRGLIRAQRVAQACNPAGFHDDVCDEWRSAVARLPGAQNLQVMYAAAQIWRDEYPQRGR